MPFFGLVNSDRKQRADSAGPIGGAEATLPEEALSGQEATVTPEQVQFWLKMSFFYQFCLSAFGHRKIRGSGISSYKVNKTTQFPNSFTTG